MKKNSEQFPTRFHIGTQKAGSTYLYNLLKSHPRTTMSTEHKVCFFSGRFDKGLGWYKSIFPDGEYKIDTTPDGLKHSKRTPVRIAQTYGNLEGLQFVALLRNPIDYVASHFYMHKKLQRYKDDPEHYPQPDQAIDDYVRKYPEYFDRGKYASLLDDWLEFFDKDQIKIFIFEEFIEKPQEITAQMLKFWNIPEPNKKLTVNQVSQNKALKYSWLYRIRSRIAEHEWLKDWLKQNRFMNWIVNNFFTTSPAGKLSKNQREKLAEVFVGDVKKLKDEHNLDVSHWEDFV